MESMNIDETLKKVMKYYPTRPFMAHDVLGLYVATLYTQKYLKKVDTLRIAGVRHVYMVSQ